MAQMAQMGRAQLDARLDAIIRTVTLFAAQVEQNAAAREVARDVRAEAERARSVAETLERLSGLERASLRLGAVVVSDLLMAALARWKIRAPKQTFELALPGHEPTLLGDGALIEQAIEGVIAWAAAHSGPGDIRVSLRQTHPEPRPEANAEHQAVAGDGHIIISVRCLLTSADDTQTARLLDSFDQPQAGDSCALELALARAIAERHGGRVWAEVASGETGALLALSLPSAPDPATQSATLAATHQEASEDGDAATGGDAPALARARHSIVVAHGDARMARYLRANLEAADYTAKTATTLSAALKLIELEEPDLALLDLALPDDEQRDPLARVLARTTAPIVALGGADPAACVGALDAGAADYIAQPLSVEEALARVRRALRPLPGQASEPRQRIFTCGDLVIDDAQRLVTIGGVPTQLSKTEYRLLRTLAQNLGKTLSHEALLAQVWGPAYSKEIEFVWVYIRRLRRKIEPDPARPRYILTAPGVGYRLAQPAAE
jgi:DNA-binding response OmpR family regulator